MKNPPAFPTEIAYYEGVMTEKQTGPSSGLHPGMTLRDYFAAKAMQGLMGRVWTDDHGKLPENIFEIWSKSAYKMADAMLAARSS